MRTLNPFKLLPALSILAAAITLGLSGVRSEAADKAVLVTLADPSYLPEVRIFSDGLGTYSQADAQVKSFIGLGGQLRFHTYDSPTRSVKVDFTGYVGVNGALPFTDARLVQGNIVTLGEDTDGNGVLTAPQLDPGSRGERFDLLNPNFLVSQTRRIGLQMTFPIKIGKTTKNWRVRWGGGETVGGATAGLVTVERLSATAWMIFPGANDKAAVSLAGSATTVGVYLMPVCVLVEVTN